MPVILQRLWIQLTADKKRFAVLCTVLGVGMLLWARLIIVSNVPRTAVATDDTSTAQSSDMAKPQSTEQGRRDSATGSRTRTAVILDREPLRDPFVISPTHFPKPSGDTQFDIAGKLDAQAAEEAEARYLAILDGLARQFRLEAVMSGEGEGGGMAVISGKPWRLGQMIPAVNNSEILFELSEIRSRSVVLRFEEHTFELSMPSVR